MLKINRIFSYYEMGTYYMRNTAEGTREFKIVSNVFFHTKNRKMEVTRKSCSLSFDHYLKIVC